MVHSNGGLDTHKVFLHGPFECLFRRTKKIDSRFIQVAVFRHTQIFSDSLFKCLFIRSFLMVLTKQETKLERHHVV